MLAEEEELRSRIARIRPLDADAQAAARAYQDGLAMPPGSMGFLQELAVQLAGIGGSCAYPDGKKRVIVLCADNGVVAEGVASTPQSVTLKQAENMIRRVTGMSCLAERFGDEVQVVDVGINGESSVAGILRRKIRAHGTADIALGPAMTRAEAVRAVLTGMQLAEQAAGEHVRFLGVGEMGIGNTTTSAAVLSALEGLEPEAVTGRGSGLTDAAFAHKKEIVAQALRRNAACPDDVLDVLSKLGGLDIAAMCGVFLGAALCRIPAVIDGYISAVAALCAFRLAPLSRDFCIPSHCSEEPGYAYAMRALRMQPPLMLRMRLGEGSGCPLMFRIVEASCALMTGMASFSQADIDDAYLDALRDTGRRR